MLGIKLKNQERDISHLLKLCKAQKKLSMVFLQRLISAVNRIVSDSEVRKILIESLAFENANSECKRMMRPLKARSAPIDE